MDETAPSRLLALLDLEAVAPDLFRGYSPPSSGRQVYGGQAVAQALVAATRTVPADRPVHSLHGYFVLAGDPMTPIDFAVERVRDGKSFTTRRCNATQRGQTIFSMEASFQRREQGLTHAVPMPDAPDPESLDDVHALVERFRAFLPEQVESWLDRRSALDMRVVAPDDVFFPERRAAGQMIWFRVRGALPDDPGIHNALLAYLSDMTLLNTALLVHGLTIFDPKIQVASLDHALWIHEALRVDQWLLYAQKSPWAGGARALTRGEIFTREGRLVASVSQEGLVRLRDAAQS
ncbi:acyl-CoA thioesterase II [Methylocystis sp.]|uniref:acyl-CoA thioesterase n=1 Tax=Methylocystis sp. TaxID=1911079 RepID=UPI0025D1A9F0|nr:acyl-CoA thioesterase II [Methylocystis sp.]